MIYLQDSGLSNPLSFDAAPTLISNFEIPLDFETSKDAEGNLVVKMPVMIEVTCDLRRWIVP